MELITNCPTCGKRGYKTQNQAHIETVTKEVINFYDFTLQPLEWKTATEIIAQLKIHNDNKNRRAITKIFKNLYKNSKYFKRTQERRLIMVPKTRKMTE